MKTSHEFPADYSPSPGTSRSAEVPSEWAGWRFDAVLAKLFPEHSRSRLQGWLKDGLIRLDGADVPMLHLVDTGDEAAMATGMRVKVRWAAERRGSITDIACFVPA